ncbi:hypothetical protein KBC04_04605 [Candidatus Babeliales bacterium]|nr:hypothetical protein [Candidatus Babeliales bacterium]MBP9844102.1 hypothetical protein [Candidatus Babeliales bacterium]
MNKEISFRNLSRAAWHDFSQERFSWILLAAGNLGIVILTYFCKTYSMPLVAILLNLLSIIYSVMLSKKALNLVYGKESNIFQVTPSFFIALLWNVALVLAVSSYSRKLILIQDNSSFNVINVILYAIASYFIVRFVFVDLVLLEEESKISDAFRKSFQITQHRFFLLVGIYSYFSLVLFLSLMTVVGYLFVFPYVMIMRVLLFKHVSENLKS